MRRGVRKAVEGLDHGRQRVGIVAVIDHHRGPFDLQHVEPAGHLVAVGGDGFGPGADQVQRNAQRPGGRDRRQGVFHLEADLAVARQRQAIERQDRFLAVALGQNHLAVADEGRPAADAAVPHDDGMIAVDGEENHPAGAMGRHLHDQRIVGIQDGIAAGHHRLDDAAFHAWPALPAC